MGGHFSSQNVETQTRNLVINSVSIYIYIYILGLNLNLGLKEKKKNEIGPFQNHASLDQKLAQITLKIRLQNHIPA